VGSGGRGRVCRQSRENLAIGSWKEDPLIYFPKEESLLKKREGPREKEKEEPPPGGLKRKSFIPKKAGPPQLKT